MFQLHVVLDSPQTWIELVPPWITASASVITVVVVVLIARNQNRLQTTLATMQMQQQERQLRKDLFDRRFVVYTDTREFMNYVIRNDGKIVLSGPEHTRFLETVEKAEMLFLGSEVHEYLTAIVKAAGDLCAYTFEEAKAVSTSNVELIKLGADLRKYLYVTLLQRRNEVFRPSLTL